jgi:hypothetical protein
MQSITIKFLNAQVDRLNREMNLPLVPYSREVGNKFTAQIGNFHLSGAYGGYSLHKMETTGGGISDVFGCGHVPKRDLSARISAMIAGINVAQRAADENTADRLHEMDVFTR